MSNYAIEVSDSTFEAEVLQSATPVLVDFWAVWCGPCKMISPVIEDLAKRYDGKVKIAKVDIDANQNVAGRYAVTSIPTVLFFKNGQVVDSVVGAAKAADYERRLQSIVG